MSDNDVTMFNHIRYLSSLLPYQPFSSSSS